MFSVTRKCARVIIVAAMLASCITVPAEAASTMEDEVFDVVISQQDEQTIKGWGVFPAWNRSDWGRQFVDKTGAQEALYDDLGVTMFRVMIPASAGDGDGNLVPARIQEIRDLIETAHDHDLYDYMISVWSPPVGMKTHPTVNGWTGSEHVRLRPDKEETYADFLTDVIQALVADGASAPRAISFQNEPLSQIVSEWCYWGGDNGQQFQRFTKLLRQKLDQSGLEDVRIVAPEGATYHENEKLLGENFDAVAADPVLEAAIGGFASHSYVSREFSSKATIESYKHAVDRFPDKDRWQTEYSSLLTGISQQDMAIDVSRRLISDMAYIRNNYWFWWLGWDHQRTIGYVGEVITEGDGYTVDKSKAFHMLSKVFGEVPAGSSMRRVSADPLSGLVTEDELWMDAVAFADGDKTVALLVNPLEEVRRVNVAGLSGAAAKVYQMTDTSQEIDGMLLSKARNVVNGAVADIALPARSVTVIVSDVADEAPPLIVFDQKDSSSVLDADYAVRQAAFTVSGRLDEPGMLQIDGQPVTVGQDLRFETVVSLSPGGNTIVAEATDASANASDEMHLFVRHDPAYLGVSLNHRDTADVNVQAFTLSGVANDAATVSVTHIHDSVVVADDSVAAVLSPGPGTPYAPFETELTLREGVNHIEVAAVNGLNEQSETVEITVVYDSVAPVITIPVTDTAAAASYVLRGSLSEEATLRVNGVVQRVAPDLSFAVIVPVEEGVNVIAVTAQDRAGNLTSQELTVTAAVPQDSAIAPGLIQADLVAPEDVTIDGELSEPHWHLNHRAAKLLAGSSDNDVAFSTAWNEEFLYVGIRVIDVHKVNDSTRGYEDDSVEIYIDGNNGRSGTYGSEDHQITLGWQDAELSVGRNITGIQFAQQDQADGYTVEFAIPWDGIGIDPPQAGTVIGFDIGNNDDDGTNNGFRQGQLMWHGNLDNWSNTSAFGSLFLNDGRVTTIAPPAQTPIVIDGVFAEAAWSISETVDQVMTGNPAGALTFGVLSDKDHLYIGLDVQADELGSTEEEQVELFLGGDALERGDASDPVRRIVLDRRNGTVDGDLGVVHYGRTEHAEGYSIELAIPWDELEMTPTRHLALGLEIAYTRTDATGTSVLAWSGAASPHASTAEYGNVLLHNFDLPKREVVVVEPPGLRVFRDQGRNLSKLEEHSANIVVVGWDPEKFDGDADRIGHSNDNPATPEYVVYKSPHEDIFSFSILTGQFDNTPGFRFYVSSDGINYTQINADSRLIGGQYSYSVRERTSHRLGTGARYLKIEFPGTLHWHAYLLDVSFKYAGDTTWDELEDDASDLSLLHGYSPGIRIASYDPHKFGGDANRFKHATDNPTTPEFVEYASPDGDIFDFTVETAVYQGTAPFKILGSADGQAYEEIAVSRTLVRSGFGYAVHENVPADELDEGIRYLRIQFPGAANWHEYINHVHLSYRVLPEQPSELEFVDDGIDLSKLYQHSSTIAIASYEPAKFGGDADRFKHTSNHPSTPEFIAYQSPAGDITDFRIVTARYQGTPPFVFLVSADGISYDELPVSTTLLSSGQGFAVQQHVSADPLVPGIRYVKVQFPGTANWHAYVNQVSFTYWSS
ncbi:sugar-binding protein [Paenibacillus sp. 1P07SE]|uniref:sugar-binding protein n=1 Tax=Paenibacillus sp. 1P07SE TaxID=3132209 RepID=UPI0039A6CE84